MGKRVLLKQHDLDNFLLTLGLLNLLLLPEWKNLHDKIISMDLWIQNVLKVFFFLFFFLLVSSRICFPSLSSFVSR